MKSKVLRFLRLLLSLVPTPMPTGKTAMDNWMNDIIYLAGPIADPDSMRFVICDAIMRFSSTKSVMPKFYFVLFIRTAAAKQLAGAAFYEIKMKQQAVAKAAEEEMKAQLQASATSPANAQEKV